MGWVCRALTPCSSMPRARARTHTPQADALIHRICLAARSTVVKPYVNPFLEKFGKNEA